MENFNNQFYIYHSRLSELSISCCQHTKPTQKHHIANRTASQWLTPFACFGLTHAPKRLSGFVWKNTVIGKCNRKAATAYNERFHASGGVSRWKVSGKQQVKWLVASVCSPPLRQTATTLVASWVQNRIGQ
jgi:hypothetical protein